MNAVGWDPLSDEVLLVAIGEADRGALTAPYHAVLAYMSRDPATPKRFS